MNFEQYLRKFEEIINQEVPEVPYTDPDYLDYAKLNLARSKRWLKTGKLSPETLTVLESIQEKQHWIIITEPWCGDAAHSVPFIDMMAKVNPLITTSYELRDAAPNRIEQYLTNGSKSIPKLIIRNEQGNDLAVWGPRPASCQEFFMKSVEDKTDISKIKEFIQTWYNSDKGHSIQHELVKILQNIK